MTLMLHEDKPPLDEALLMHFGVKGMKWGVRKPEDTSSRKPAKSAPSSRDQRRAKNVAKLQSKASALDTKISDLKKANEGLTGIKGKIQIRNNNGQIQELSKQRDRLLKDAQAKQNHKLTSTQKKMLVGGAVVVGVAAGLTLASAHDSGALNSSILRGQAFLKGEKVPFKTNENLTGKKTVDELLHQVAKPVNPGYAKAGGKMNCRRSTFAYELRRRGFDVTATTSAAGTGQSESGFINAVTPGSKKFYNGLSVTDSIQKSEQAYYKSVLTDIHGNPVGNEALRVSGGALKDARANPLTKTVIRGLRVGKAQSLEDFDKGLSVSESSSKAVLEALAKQPEGARGEVLFNFGTFGHSMAYEVVDGTPHIFDSQKGVLYNATNLVEGKWDGFHSAEITRLDNVNLDLSFLSRWATNAGG